MTIHELRDNLQSGRNLIITAKDQSVTAWASIMEDTYIIDEHLVPIDVIMEFQESGQWNVHPEPKGTDHHATD